MTLMSSTGADVVRCTDAAGDEVVADGAGVDVWDGCLLDNAPRKASTPMTTRASAATPTTPSSK